jgi:CRP/FNR family transcriptional regulator, anaerobic regulatory protein
MFTHFFSSNNDPIINQIIESKFKEVTYKKNELILRKGNVCTQLYFIEKGLVRGFCIVNEKDNTNWFAPEGTLATSVYSIISKKPSLESIITLEDCKMQTISRNDLYDLYERFPVINEMGRKLIETYYLELEERVQALQFDTAKERYLSFINKEGKDLLQRVSLGHIASYLGITQETLSRIRNPSK